MTTIQIKEEAAALVIEALRRDLLVRRAEGMGRVHDSSLAAQRARREAALLEEALEALGTAR